VNFVLSAFIRLENDFRIIASRFSGNIYRLENQLITSAKIPARIQSYFGRFVKISCIIVGIPPQVKKRRIVIRSSLEGSYFFNILPIKNENP